MREPFSRTPSVDANTWSARSGHCDSIVNNELLLGTRPLRLGLDSRWKVPLLGELLDQLTRRFIEPAVLVVEFHPVAELAGVVTVLAPLHAERVEARSIFRLRVVRAFLSVLVGGQARWSFEKPRKPHQKTHIILGTPRYCTVF